MPGLGHFYTSYLFFLLFVSCSCHVFTVPNTRVKQETSYIVFKYIWPPAPPMPIHRVQISSNFFPHPFSSLPLLLPKQLQVSKHIAFCPEMHSLHYLPMPSFSFQWTPMHPSRPNSNVVHQGFPRSCSHCYMQAQLTTSSHWAVTAPLWVSLWEEVSHCNATTCSHACCLPP